MQVGRTGIALCTADPASTDDGPVREEPGRRLQQRSGDRAGRRGGLESIDDGELSLLGTRTGPESVSSENGGPSLPRTIFGRAFQAVKRVNVDERGSRERQPD